jgi:hypothetical protein
MKKGAKIEIHDLYTFMLNNDDPRLIPRGATVKKKDAKTKS